MIKYYAARNHPLAKGFENLSCGEILVKAKRRITVLNLGYTLRGLAKTPHKHLRWRALEQESTCKSR